MVFILKRIETIFGLDLFCSEVADFYFFTGKCGVDMDTKVEAEIITDTSIVNSQHISHVCTTK